MPASTHASPDASAGEGHARRTLPKESLIRKNAEYSLCYAEGRRVHTRHFLLFVLGTEDEGAKPETGLKPGLGPDLTPGLRMGCAVSRKVGRAVVRNRVKRLLRECFRLYLRQMAVPGRRVRLVVVAKRQTGVDRLGLAGVAGEIVPALERHFKLWGAQ